MKTSKQLMTFILILIGCSMFSQNIRVRGVGVALWNVNARGNDQQHIYPLGIGEKFETRSQYNKLGDYHFWTSRPSAIRNLDYATTPIRSNDERRCSMDQFSVDERTTVTIAVPISNMNASGWTRTSTTFRTSISTFYLYTYNYTTPNRWIDIPYNDRDRPTIVFGPKDGLRFDNPPSISDLAEGVVIASWGGPYNRSPGTYDPDLIIRSNGDYIAGRSGSRYISKDKGKTWTKLNRFSYKVRHATTFEHKGDLYIIGDTRGPGAIVRSTDGGRTWSSPVQLLDNFRNSPSHVEVGNGRIWIAYEYAQRPRTINFLSASVNSNLMDPDSWVTTRRTDNNGTGNETDMVMGRNGFPIAMPKQGPPVRALSATRASAENDRNRFSLPGSGSKYSAKYDPVTDKYWALTSVSDLRGDRTGITLFSSTDLYTWKKERVVLQGTSSKFHGFNYPSMQFDGDDIVFVSRTAWESQRGQPVRWHDANMFTFHRVRNFRGGATDTCSIVPFVNKNGEGWNSVSSVDAEVGDDIWFGPQSNEYGAEGGNWSWTGPNGFTSSGRSLELSDIQSNQAGAYTVTNVDQDGCTASSTFTISMPGTCTIVPFINHNNDGWNSVNTVVAATGDEIWFGPQSGDFGAEGGDWSWTGPNGFTYSGRSLRIRNIQPNQAGTYIVTNEDQNGCSTTGNMIVTMNTVSSVVGTFNLKNVKTGTYLDADPGAIVKQGNPRDGRDTRWNISISSEGYHFLDNGMADRGPLAAKPSLGNSVTYLAERYNASAYVNREWKAIPVSGSVYKFLCKDERRGYVAAIGGNDIQNIADGDDTAAHWELIPVDTKNPGTPEEELFGLTISPNPFVNDLVIEGIANLNTAALRITDISGKMMSASQIKAESASGNQIRLNTSSWSTGMYFISFMQGQERITKKIIKL